MSGRGWRAALASALIASTLLLAGGAARATDHALLIGVSDYPNLPKRLWLKGPGNDVALMARTLQVQGFDAAHIRQLTSRSDADHEPTRANILRAMTELRAAVRAGDHVVLYLAGHGSQQPQPTPHPGRPDEPDGLDEVFLPADAARWQGDTSAVAIPNALLDDEIGEWIDGVVDRGATVWAIFDTCHAGGMARGRSARLRAVPPAELGLPAPRGSSRSPAARPSPSTGRSDGRVLALAARTHEATGEEWLPGGATMGSNHLHGVFTFHVAQALSAMPRPTAPALERAVRAAYARERRVAPTPQFKGDPATPLR